MKKKIIPLLVCFVLLVAIAAMAVACTNTTHEHVFSEEWTCDGAQHWHVCTEEGCTETSEKTYHDYTSTVIKEATCTETGEETLTCKICGHTENAKIPLKAHAYVEYQRIEPTCTQKGTSYKECSVCNEKAIEVLDALGHDIVLVDAKNVSCTEAGWDAYIHCTRCDYTTFSEIPATGHDWKSFSEQLPTCTQSGHNAYSKCMNCGSSDYVELPALGHKITFMPDTPATCTEFGCSAHEYCERCSYATTYETYAPLGHELENHNCIRCTKSLYDSNLYGYEFFATMPQGEGMQALYDQIATAAEEFDRNNTSDVEENAVLVSIDFATLGLDYTQAGAVWKTFKDDNPIYYWMANQVNISGNEIDILIDGNYRLGETRIYCKALIDEAVAELSSLIYVGASAYDIALCYHDNILLAIDYAYNGGEPETALWAHNIIGVLEKTGAVCEGYARTFQLLLNYSDVENLLVTGESQGVGHAWNLIKLDDGQWYWCDLTFDDISTRGYGYTHNYFCKTDDDFLSNHEFAISTNEGVDFLYDLPDRADTDYVPEEPTVGTVFETDNMQLKIVGYNEVTVLKYYGEGTCVIPETVTYDGRIMNVVSLGEDNRFEIFDYQKPVKTVYIPASVRNIWDYALASVHLENIFVADDNQVYTDIDGVLYTKNLYTLIQFPSSSPMTKLVVPDETCCISHHAFEDCKNLSSFTLGPNVSKIGVANWGLGYPTSKTTFVNLISGTTGELIDSLAGKKEFIIAPGNTYYVIDGAGVYNSSKTVLYYAFDTVTEFVIPSTLKRIEDYSVYDMFEFCTKLEKFVLEENNSYFAVYDGILYNGDFSVMYTVPKAIRGKITLHEGLAKIGNTAFSGCVNLTEVTLPASVTNLGSYVFNDCSALEKVIFTNPAGWSVINPVNNKSTPINEEDLSDPVKAKDLLSDYISYKWQRA